jgi:hypothetical protein
MDALGLTLLQPPFWPTLRPLETSVISVEPIARERRANVLNRIAVGFAALLVLIATNT